MIEYFDTMAESMEKISEDAENLSRAMGRIINDDTERTHHATQNVFGL